MRQRVAALTAGNRGKTDPVARLRSEAEGKAKLEKEFAALRAQQAEEVAQLKHPAGPSAAALERRLHAAEARATRLERRLARQCQVPSADVVLLDPIWDPLRHMSYVATGSVDGSKLTQCRAADP